MLKDDVVCRNYLMSKYLNSEFQFYRKKNIKNYFHNPLETAKRKIEISCLRNSVRKWEFQILYS